MLFIGSLPHFLACRIEELRMEKEKKGLVALMPELARHLRRMNCTYSDYVFCYPLFEGWQKSVINLSFGQMVKTYTWHVLVTFRFVRA